MTMLLKKTDKGLAELASRERTLNVKERALLLLADGRTASATLLAQVRATEDVLTRLVSDGYLAAAADARASASGAARPAAPRPATTEVAAPTPAVPVAADRFEGKKSLAAARMYLFDMTDRLYARKLPDLAESIRQELREARDVDAMLTAASRLLHTVETMAGSERAEAISERLSKLLPDHAMAIE